MTDTPIYDRLLVERSPWPFASAPERFFIDLDRGAEGRV